MTRIGKLVFVVAIGGLLIGIATRSTNAQSRAKSHLPAHHRDPIGLRVTDIKGKIVTLLFDNGTILIDYTSYPSMGVYTPDYEYHGLRIVSHGEGRLLAKWDQLLRIDLTNFTDGGAEAQIASTTGDTHTVTLVLWSREGLMGKAELGEFSIDLNKVKTIEVIR